MYVSYCCDGPFATCYEHSVSSYPSVTPLRIRNSPQSGIPQDPEDPIYKDEHTHAHKPPTVTTEESPSHTRTRTPSLVENPVLDLAKREVVTSLFLC